MGTGILITFFALGLTIIGLVWIVTNKNGRK